MTNDAFERTDRPTGDLWCWLENGVWQWPEGMTEPQKETARREWVSGLMHYCIGCGRVLGMHSGVFHEDYEPPDMPEWDFPQDTCPVCGESQPSSERRNNG